MPRMEIKEMDTLLPIAVSVFNGGGEADAGSFTAKGQTAFEENASMDSPLEEESGWAGIPRHFTSLWDEDEE